MYSELKKNCIKEVQKLVQETEFTAKLINL